MNFLNFEILQLQVVMKKLFGYLVIHMAIVLFIALIPLIFLGEHAISHEHKRSMIDGVLLFKYILIFGICLLIFNIVRGHKKFFQKDIPQVLTIITTILFLSITIGLILGVVFPEHVRYGISARSPHPIYEINSLATYIPMGIGTFISLILFGKHLSK